MFLIRRGCINTSCSHCFSILCNLLFLCPAALWPWTFIMWLFISQCIYFVLAATRPSQMGQNSECSWSVTPHFTAACVACLIAMETFPEGFPWQGMEGGRKEDGVKGVFWLRPSPRSLPYAVCSRRRGAGGLLWRVATLGRPHASCLFWQGPPMPRRPLPRCGSRGGGRRRSGAGGVNKM